MMHKILNISCTVAFCICLVAFCHGCDNKPEPPKKTKIVSKKISPRAEKTVKQKSVTAVEKTTPPAAKTTVAGVKTPEATPPGEVKSGKPVKLSKSSTPPTTSPSIIKPKADISKPAMETVKKAVKDKMKPLASVTAYNPAGKIDPFVPLFKRDRKTVAGKTGKRKKRVPMTPLEEVDLSQLKLAGILIIASGNKALVEDSTGKGYIIKPGTYIGMKEGRVVAIRKDRVIVEEYESEKGKDVLKKKEMMLQKPPGEI